MTRAPARFGAVGAPISREAHPVSGRLREDELDLGKGRERRPAGCRGPGSPPRWSGPIPWEAGHPRLSCRRQVTPQRRTYLLQPFTLQQPSRSAPVSRKSRRASYKEGEDWVFGDPETFEMITVTPEIVGEAKDYLVANGEVTMTFVEDRAVLIEIPPSVTLEVVDAPEGIRGDTASNVQKPAVLETGITIRVPLFIKNGERIRVDTRTGKYMERA